MSNDRRLRTYLATAAAASVSAGMDHHVSAAVITSAQTNYTAWTGSITAPNTQTTSFHAGLNAWAPNTQASLLPGATLAFQTMAAMMVSSSTAGRFAFFQWFGGGPLNRLGQTRLASGAVIGAAMTTNQWGSIAVFAGSLAPNAAGNVGNANFRATNNRFLSTGAGAGADSQQGYIAFRMDAGGGLYYYGYWDITLSRTGVENNSTLTFTVNGWAWESVAGQSITIPNPSAVPGGAGLAALACGAAGLRGRRRVA